MIRGCRFCVLFDDPFKVRMNCIAFDPVDCRFCVRSESGGSTPTKSSQNCKKKNKSRYSNAYSNYLRPIYCLSRKMKKLRNAGDADIKGVAFLLRHIPDSCSVGQVGEREGRFLSSDNREQQPADGEPAALGNKSQYPVTLAQPAGGEQLLQHDVKGR